MRKKRKLTKKRIILVVGMPGSGKSVAGEESKKTGFRVFSFGDIVREEVRHRGLRLDEKNVKSVADWFHSNREHLLARRAERKFMRIRTKKPLILEGARSPKQLEELQKHFDVKILEITLPKKIRWARQLARGRSDIRTLEDARKRDARELSYGINGLIKKADWRISSNCNIREYRARCRKFFKSLA